MCFFCIIDTNWSSLNYSRMKFYLNCWFFFAEFTLFILLLLICSYSFDGQNMQNQYVKLCRKKQLWTLLATSLFWKIASRKTPIQNLVTILDSSKSKHILLGGGLNCPDINGEQNITAEHFPERNVQEILVDLANNHSITQVHSDPTRNDNLLGLLFISNRSLVKSSTSLPSILDYDITISDLDIWSQYVKQRNTKFINITKQRYSHHGLTQNLEMNYARKQNLQSTSNRRETSNLTNIMSSYHEQT